MFKKLRRLFYPHPSNNYKPAILQPSGLCVLIAVFLLFQSVFNLSINLAPGVLGFASDITPEQIVDLTNKMRLENGVSSLKINEKLCRAARAKAADMFALNYWAHVSPRGVQPWKFIADSGYDYFYAGENLARDFFNSKNVVDAWMKSPTHRENLLNKKYKDICVAVVDGILQGQETTLVVQMFGAPRQSPSVIGKEGAARKTSNSEKKEGTPAAVLMKSISKKSNFPLVSGFSLTKSLSLAFAGLFLIVLVIDSFVIYKKKVMRISGNNFVHGTFVIILIVMILLTQKGLIL